MDARKFEPGPRSNRGIFGWLLPLLIGVGLGALLIGGLGLRWTHAGAWFDRGGERRGPTVSQERDAAESFEDRGRAGPMGFRGDHQEGDHFMMERGWRGGWFFPFGFGRLLVPLLLIGAGAWLLRGGRRPGNPSGGGAPPAPGTADPPPSDADPPATGPIRML